MPLYVSLMKLTEKGMADIKNAPKRLQESEKAMEQMGAKLLHFYMVMGEYDYVAVAEAPNDDVALAFLLGLGGQGNVRTVTMKAFSREHFGQLLSKLP